MTLTERTQFHAAVQVYKVLHKIPPSYLNGTFNEAVDITLHIGRNIYHLFIPRVRTALAKHRLFLPQGRKIWNPVLYTARKLEQYIVPIFVLTVYVCVYVL